MKEQRLNFSDYSAAEQEADVKKHLAEASKTIRHAYLMKIDGEWAHFIVAKKPDIDFYDDLNLSQVYSKLKQKKPDYMPRIIRNEGLENYLRDKRAEFKRNKAKQLTINFNERFNNER